MIVINKNERLIGDVDQFIADLMKKSVKEHEPWDDVVCLFTTDLVNILKNLPMPDHSAEAELDDMKADRQSWEAQWSKVIDKLNEQNEMLIEAICNLANKM